MGLVAAGLAAVGALFAQRLHAPMTFDEGVYLASLRALRDGETLAEDVFAAQPPGFYLLLRGATFVFGTEFDDIRLAFVVVAVLGCLATYALARAIAGRVAGVVAALLLAVSPPYLDNAAAATADVPAVSFALVALALACGSWMPAGPPSRVISFGALSGAMFIAAVSVKLTALLALAAFAALAVLLRPPARSLIAWAAGGLAIGGAVVAAHWRTLDEIWRDAVTFHRDARRADVSVAPHDIVGNIGKIRGAWNLSGAARWLALLGVLTAIADVARRRRRLPSPLWLWPLATVVFLLLHRPLFAHHVALLPAALAVPVGITLADSTWTPLVRRALSACVAVGLATGIVQAWVSAAGAASSQPAAHVAAANVLRTATALDEPVVTDIPSVAVLADRRIPGELVDMSYVRIESDALAVGEVLHIIDQTQVAAAVIGRALSQDSGLAAALEARFPRRTRVGALVVYTR